MDRLEVAIGLITDAKLERDRLLEYEREYEEALEKDLRKDVMSSETLPYHERYKNRWKVDEKFSPLPTKSVINENLKVARRLLLAEYRK